MATHSNYIVKSVVRATLVSVVSAYTVTYSAYPAPAFFGDTHTCNITASSTGTLTTGTPDAPGCTNISPAAFYGNFTLSDLIPADETCALNWFSGADCTGTEGPIPALPFGTSVGLPLNDTSPTSGCILLKSGHFGLPPEINQLGMSARAVCGST
ncbi:unnamed protein product [Peniophora sp. CBMAI 1063]|nr:unnamed protein product [Peniophora sp. CBMAI 1063]